MQKSNRLELIKVTFGETYNELVNDAEKETTDKGLFTNMVENLIEAVKEYEGLEVESPMIKVAFNDKFNQKFKELGELEKSLLEREMV